jgi:hypothetical protein
MQNISFIRRILKQLTLLLFLISLFLLNIACGNNSIRSLKKGRSEIVTEKYPDDIKEQPFQNSDSTWGFTIYMNGKIYIHQQLMPGSESSSGFQSKKDASKVAELIIRKIKNHISPENVRENELDSLGIVRTKKIVKL